ncbi:hypothetical protein EWE75_24180 [Sphingomonas populi]|uniref:Phage head morphogenesis domain-containing protein n=1 Tax=Sphingomonas populi TaxID=2484750 RepID=A0A4Q6XIG6_9SPHN|nr:hypothetical protein [Sphingomonas populi]RZF59005.1 hypothetical protein EWE75_24180 [Sphingomonas populi]
MIEEAAAREAVEHLGLLTPEAITTIAQLLQGDMSEPPNALATRYRKEGEQISDADKRVLRIRRNGFLSRQALAEITPAGLSDPLAAHETTLLRATFTVIRHRRVAEGAKLKERLGKCFVGFAHETLNRDCAACNRLDGLVTDAANAAILPPVGCSCPTANYGISPKIDWLADVD